MNPKTAGLRTTEPDCAGARALLAGAEQAIRAAHRLLEGDPLSAQAFIDAYSGVRRAASAVLVADGFRVSGGPGQHVAALLGAIEALGDETEVEIEALESARSRRADIEYRGFDLAPSAADEFAGIADQFLRDARRFVDERCGVAP